MSYRDYDWQTENDASTLKRYSEITGDPQRLAKAQEFLSVEVKNVVNALEGTPTVNPKGGRVNKATIQSEAFRNSI